MGQASNRSDDEVLDLVITNALVIDWSGIFKVSEAGGVRGGVLTWSGGYRRQERQDRRDRQGG
jgi:urease